MVIAKGKSQRDVAFTFRVKPSVVRNLVKNERLGKNTTRQLDKKQIMRNERQDKIRASVSSHISKGFHIWKASQMQALVSKEQ